MNLESLQSHFLYFINQSRDVFRAGMNRRVSGKPPGILFDCLRNETVDGPDIVRSECHGMDASMGNARFIVLADQQPGRSAVACRHAVEFRDTVGRLLCNRVRKHMGMDIDNGFSCHIVS